MRIHHSRERFRLPREDHHRRFVIQIWNLEPDSPIGQIAVKDHLDVKLLADFVIGASNCAAIVKCLGPRSEIQAGQSGETRAFGNLSFYRIRSQFRQALPCHDVIRINFQRLGQERARRWKISGNGLPFRAVDE